MGGGGRKRDGTEGLRRDGVVHGRAKMGGEGGCSRRVCLEMGQVAVCVVCSATECDCGVLAQSANGKRVAVTGGEGLLLWWMLVVRRNRMRRR